MSARRFELVEGTSSKFWEVEVQGTELHLAWGRIGTDGQSKVKTLASAATAGAEAEALVREKLGKGYREVDAPIAAPRPAAAPKPAPTPPPEVVSPVTGEATVRWTPALRKKLQPRRGQAVDGPQPVSRGDAFKRLGDVFRPLAHLWAAGLAHADERHRPLMESVSASLAAPEAPPATLDPAVEGARAAMLGVESSAVYNQMAWGVLAGNANRTPAIVATLAFWRESGGAALAVECLARAGGYQRHSDVGHQPTAMWLGARGSVGEQDMHLDPAWWALRKLLCSAPEEEWEAARTRAAAQREEAGARVRFALAYAFDEPSWAAEDAASFLAPAPPLASRWGAGRSWWLFHALQDAGLATRLAPYCPWVREDLTLDVLEHLGPAAVQPLAAMCEPLACKEARTPDELRAAIGTLALVESREAADFFASHLHLREVNRAAQDYLHGLGAVAEASLAEAARTGSREAAHMYAAITGRPAPGLEPSAPVEEAPLDALPAVLARPPWLDRKPARKPTAMELAAPPVAARVEWAPGEREAARVNRYARFGEASAANDEAILARMRARLAGQKNADFWQLRQLTDAAALAAWNEIPATAWGWVDPSDLSHLLARHGEAALPGLVAYAGHDPTKAIGPLAHVFAPGLVPVVADAAARLKKVRPAAEDWLVHHAALAAPQLIPVALGPAGSPRQAAEQALRLLASRGREAVVREAASSFGAEAEAAVADLLADDGTLGLPARLPKLPAFWAPAAWPRPLLRDGRALPLGAVDHLGTMLAFSPLSPPWPRLAEVRAACDPHSLADFAWTLFEAWQTAGAPPREAWAYQALAHLGNDETARRLAPLVREWPGMSLSARAVTGLDILSAIGTDAALTLLHGISQKVKSRPLQERATARLAAIAETRGLTTEELADRLVPDLGLDAAGARVLDFGPRQFRVGFDEQLRPVVRTLGGDRLKDLPKPGKADEPARAADAVATWKVLKKTAAAVMPVQLGRLERAMCQRRTWTGGDFRTLLVRHPLLCHVVRRLVWAVADDVGRPTATFRVAEDGTCASVEDDPFALADDARVVLPHPLDLPAGDVARWSQVLADYELLQPFPQLGRTVFRFTEAELPSALRRVAGRKVHVGKVLGLERRGWRRGPVGDGGMVGEMVKDVGPRGWEAQLALDPGIITGVVTEFAEQTLGAVEIRHEGTWDASGLIPPQRLDPLVVSELVADLDSIVS